MFMLIDKGIIYLLIYFTSSWICSTCCACTLCCALLTGVFWWGEGGHSVKDLTLPQVFDNNISYIEGGTASGFYTVEDTHYVTR